VKHKFLLDENILHFAVKGINERDERDETSIELVRRIATNCHRIVLNEFVRTCYWKQLNKMRGPRDGSWATERISFVNSFIRKAEKLSFEANEYPELPVAVIVPAEDIEIVRITLVAEAKLVTGDAGLRAALHRYPQLNIRALHPADALPFAAET
jgi:hypothetical protein